MIEAIHNGNKCSLNITKELENVLQNVSTGHRGSFAFVQDHVSGTPGKDGCLRSSISDKWFISHPRYDRYLSRLEDGILTASVESVAQDMPQKKWDEMTKKANIAGIDLCDLYTQARTALLESIAGSRMQDMSNGHRRAHVSCYASYTGGDISVTLHLLTEKVGDETLPVLENGMMTVKSIMLPFFEINRVPKQQGEWKPVNSRPLTMMKDAIRDMVVPYEWHTLSLGKGNFSSLCMNSHEIYGFIRGTEHASVTAALGEFYMFVGNLQNHPFESLAEEAQNLMSVFATH